MTPYAIWHSSFASHRRSNVSFRYRLIVSFITIEALFLAMIVFINFSSLQHASESLINEKVEAASELFAELIKAPVAVYDLATVDDALSSFVALKNVAGTHVRDVSGRVLSEYHAKERLTQEDFERIVASSVLDEYVMHGERTFIAKRLPLVAEETALGDVLIIYDITQSLDAISENRTITYILVAMEILLSSLLAYFLGWRITQSLNTLTQIAQKVADDESVTVALPAKQRDEIDQLFVTMHIMQERIHDRNDRLNAALSGLQQMMHAIDESALVSKTDPHGVITYVNRAFCEVNGYSPEELLGKTHKLLRHSETSSEFYAQMWEVISRKEVFKGTLCNKKKNGESYYIDLTIVPLVNTEGEIVEYLASAYDVTELVLARDRAVAGERAKSEFLSNMSHEIRTPLNAILGFIGQLKKRVTDEKSSQYLSIVDRSSKMLMTIINDILDISKLQSGKLAIDRHPCHLVESIASTVELFAQTARDKKISYLTYIDPGLPPCLLADDIRIQQITANLLSNALKFTAENGTVKLTMQYDEAKEVLKLAVQDNGIGMSESAQKSVFNAFEQADGSTTRQYGGTGLGLAIVSKLVELMDGSVAVESAEGKGSIFRVDLPMQRCPSCLPDTVTYAEALKGKSVALRCSVESLEGCEALAKKYVTAMGGEVDSAEGTQLLTLDTALMPLTPQKVLNAIEELPKAQSSGIKVSEQEEFSALQGKVLVVEDNVTNQFLVEVLLEQYGLEHVICSDGEEGVQTFKNGRFDLVLMDENMPKKNGIEALQEIRSFEAEQGRDATPVIALTANALATDRQRFLDAGMDDFIAKPIEEKAFGEILMRYLPH